MNRNQLTLDVCVDNRDLEHPGIPAVAAPPPLAASVTADGEEPPGQTLTRADGQPATPGEDGEQAPDESAADAVAAALPGQIAAATAAIRAHVSNAWRNRLSALRGTAGAQPGPGTDAKPGEPGGQAGDC